MPRPRTTNKPRSDNALSATPTDNALYTYDLLISLKRLADGHRQTQLSRLIEEAAAEAYALSRRQEAEAN